MMNYMDQLSPKEWQALLDELMVDGQHFFQPKKAFDHQAYCDNVAVIKRKKMPKQGIGLPQIMDDIRHNILPGAIHQHHKNYIAFPDKGSLVAAQYATLLAALTNQNLIAEDKSAPTGTYIEMLVIAWLRRLIGYKQDDVFPSNALVLGGAFVTGGVMANTIGLLGARQRAFPESKAKGMQAIKKVPKIFVAGPTMNHYSHFGSSWWLGFGTENVVEVACTDKGNMDQADLKRRLELCLANGEQPVAIIALVGDSRTNTIDDLPGLFKIAKQYNVWLHADACHGGLLAFDDSFTHQGRHYLWYADSVTMDPHKHLGVPYANSLILFKNLEELAAIGSSTDITIAYGGNDIGQITPFTGSRSFDALKLYAAIQQYGSEGIKRSIDKRKKITKTWHDLILASPVLTPLHEPELFALAFSIRPDTLKPDELSFKNKQLHDQLQQDGEVIVHTYSMCDYRNKLGYGRGTRIKALGSLFGSDNYTKKDLQDILKKIEDTYYQLF